MQTTRNPLTWRSAVGASAIAAASVLLLSGPVGSPARAAATDASNAAAASAVRDARERTQDAIREHHLRERLIERSRGGGTGRCPDLADGCGADGR